MSLFPSPCHSSDRSTLSDLAAPVLDFIGSMPVLVGARDPGPSSPLSYADRIQLGLETYTRTQRDMAWEGKRLGCHLGVINVAHTHDGRHESHYGRRLDAQVLAELQGTHSQEHTARRGAHRQGSTQQGSLSQDQSAAALSLAHLQQSLKTWGLLKIACQVMRPQAPPAPRALEKKEAQQALEGLVQQRPPQSAEPFVSWPCPSARRRPRVRSSSRRWTKLLYRFVPEKNKNWASGGGTFL